MTGADHIKILAIGFAAFAAILFFTFLLLALVSVGVFVALGITFANESGDANQAGVGILGAIFTVIFYGGLGLVCVLPPALASWKMFKRKPAARFWGIVAADRVATNHSTRNRTGCLRFVVLLQLAGSHVRRDVA